MHGEFCCACLNRLWTRDAPTPTYISIKSELIGRRNGTSRFSGYGLGQATVLPVPGGGQQAGLLRKLLSDVGIFSRIVQEIHQFYQGLPFASSSPATSAKSQAPVSLSAYTSWRCFFPHHPLRFIMKFIMITIRINGSTKLTRDSIMAMLSWRSPGISPHRPQAGGLPVCSPRSTGTGIVLRSG